MKREPKKGEQIYIPTSICVFRGEDDFIGGLATIDEISYNKNLPENDYNYCFVVVKEHPETKYNWNHLLEKQKELKKRFKNKVAHPDPDLRPEFNDENEGWHQI
jgi:uncharacterized protein YjbK